MQDHHRETQALQSQLCRIQPLANIGSASCMIAHEINNILTPFGAYADLALKHFDDKALVKKALEKAVLNCQRATKVMESMLALANGDTQQKQTVSLSGLIDEVFTCLCRDFGKDRIQLKIDIPEGLKVHVVAVQIQQVLMNLSLNAREAMLSRGGALSLRGYDDGDHTIIEVADTGAGIAPEHMSTIFEAFYSTKDSSDSAEECFGTGLGLAFCRLVIDKHHGSITVKSKQNEGTTFKISLPKVPPVSSS
ncbi:MAG: HAMP domain-containing histidine kinase [Planctomycetes bacterium]|nr:HAMP domain-containing histidine kinase [Planctomycetota bacterium]